MSYSFTLVTRDNIIQLAAAYLGLLSVYAWSAWSYVLYGPRNAAWDFRTHYIRDLLMYMLAHQADAGIQLMIKLTNGVWPELTTAMQRVPQGFASRIIIPAYPLGSLPPCVWAEALQEVAHASQGRGMHAECIIAHSGSTPLASGVSGRREPKVILHFHGGAYVSGTLEQYRPVHTLLSQSSGLRVYGFAYRLAPHSVYPTQLYDAYCAFSHLLALGYKESEIVFTGDSAGGNLALALWQLLKKPDLYAMVLVSPRVDVTCSRRSWALNADADVLTPYNIQNASDPLRKLLVPQGRPVDQRVLDLLNDPYISPVNGDLSGLPPTLVQAATAEVMFDDISEFVKRAQAQNTRGHRIHYQVFEGGFHDFQFVPMLVKHSIQARQAIGKFTSEQRTLNTSAAGEP
ncbi:hypothetical protein IWW47_000513 [Coemansia sp. RSA 2052]|nr:hypothetical protein IWW47_000513 [Coemansia sp. RSA 2052]